MTAATLAELAADRAAKYAMNSDSLKAWRIRLHLSTEGAAVLLGVSQRSYEAWEYGRHRVPLTVAILAARIEKTGLVDVRPADRPLLAPMRAIYR